MPASSRHQSSGTVQLATFHDVRAQQDGLPLSAFDEFSDEDDDCDDLEVGSATSSVAGLPRKARAIKPARSEEGLGRAQYASSSLRPQASSVSLRQSRMAADLRDSGISLGMDQKSITSHATGRLSTSTAWTQSRRPSSRCSVASSTSSQATLPALQTKGGPDLDGLEPLTEEEVDTTSFDLVIPAHALGKQYTLEAQSELLFSLKHLSLIFDDPVFLRPFTNFLHASRPDSVPILLFYLDALKALRAIDYANAISSSLKPIEGLAFTAYMAKSTNNNALRDQANEAFGLLAYEDLPAFITQKYVQIVSLTIKRRIADTLPSHLRELSEGLAEVFCLTDPSRPDNPIVFASEEFHRTTQYGINYVLGRNGRFLQGPKTNHHSVRRLHERLEAGREHCETFLNYRRDGSPFMNLLMVAPLYDSKGVVRYWIGAQIDVSGLVKECAGLESFARLLDREQPPDPLLHLAGDRQGDENGTDDKNAELRKLVEIFTPAEMRTARESGGKLYRTRTEEMAPAEHKTFKQKRSKARLHIRDHATIPHCSSHESLDTLVDQPACTISSSSSSGRLQGIFEHYLLVRPYPNLRVLFASPSLRVPGMLQSPLMARIGGSSGVRETIQQAFADGHGITAKILWVSGSASKPRWIHSTPLLGSNGAVGVWVVMLIDDEEGGGAAASSALRMASRMAPQVDLDIPGGRSPGASSNAAMSLSDFAAQQQKQQQIGEEDFYGADMKSHLQRPPSSRRSGRGSVSRSTAAPSPLIDHISLPGLKMDDQA